MGLINNALTSKFKPSMQDQEIVTMAHIRAAAGVGEKPMLQEMPAIIKQLKEKADSFDARKHEVSFGMDIPCSDEQHMAIALYLLQKAIVLREQPQSGIPTIHACLRDASQHLEEARKFWSKEQVERRLQLTAQLLSQPKKKKNK